MNIRLKLLVTYCLTVLFLYQPLWAQEGQGIFDSEQEASDSFVIEEDKDGMFEENTSNSFFQDNAVGASIKQEEEEGEDESDYKPEYELKIDEAAFKDLPKSKRDMVEKAIRKYHKSQGSCATCGR